MKTEAAILVQTGQPLEIVSLDLPALKLGQCLVEITYSGACHTQVLEARGHKGEDKWVPHCMGHEASGKVLEIGEGVTRVKPGDAVILSWIKGAGMEAGGSNYLWKGTNVNAGGVTTFQKHSIISENRITPMPAELDPRAAIMMGCALPTGMGSVFNVAKPEAGDSLAVFGAGGIGLSAVMAAKVAGCANIIAVDPQPMKRDLAIKLGATHTIDPMAGDVTEQIKAICASGVDAAVEATGIPDVMLGALNCVRAQGGRVVICGNAHQGQVVAIDPGQFNQGKSLLGTWGGDSKPERDYPKYAELMISGAVDVSPLLSAPYALTEINRALDDLEAGSVGRPVIDMALA